MAVAWRLGGWGWGLPSGPRQWQWRDIWTMAVAVAAVVAHQQWRWHDVWEARVRVQRLGLG